MLETGTSGLMSGDEKRGDVSVSAPALVLDSTIPEQDLHATETNHAEEVLDVVLPADHEPTKMMEPGKQSFDSPTSAVAAQRTTILRRRPALSAMGCDDLDAVTLGQVPIQTVTVVRFVADQSRREGVEETVSEDAFDELAFVRRSAFDTNGKRKTVIIGESDDFRSLAAFGGPDREAPFFAPVKEASMKASSSCSFPRACSSPARVHKMRSNLPSRTHCWKRRWQVWYGGYFLGSSRNCAPVPKTHKIPLKTARVSCHGRPRPSERRFGRKIGSISCHWASLSSHRPRMPSFCLFFYAQKIAK
jgi:hypothetical protein